MYKKEINLLHKIKRVMLHKAIKIVTCQTRDLILNKTTTVVAIIRTSLYIWERIIDNKMQENYVTKGKLNQKIKHKITYLY